MGYTHYWYRKDKEHDQTEWDVFLNDCKILQKALPEEYEGKPLYLNGCFAHRDALFNKDMLYFNGGEIPSKDRVRAAGGWEGDKYSHETFSITRVANKNPLDTGIIFAFCKTAYKPYDLMVTACLIMYKYRFGSKVQISSDGGLSEWEPAFKLIAEHHPEGKEVIVEMKTNDAYLFEDCLE